MRVSAVIAASYDLGSRALLDELAGGRSPEETEELMKDIRKVKERLSKSQARGD